MNYLTRSITGIALLILPFAVQGAEIHVPADQATIQAGINTAFPGDTVLIADGTYSGAGNRDLDYSGKAITVMSENGAGNCIIDCGGTPSEAHRGFYFHSNEGNDSVLQGVTIMNGNTNSIGYSNGGAIWIDSGCAPVIRACVISSNTAPNGGGIGTSSLSNPQVFDCIITGNSATLRGGGVSLWGDAYFLGCTISNNYADYGGGGGLGGGPANLVLVDCTISDNTTSDWGGGFRLSYWTNGGVFNCRITGNTANGPGGGVYTEQGHYSIVNTLIAGNQGSAGGGMSCQYSTIQVVNSTFVDNIATYTGGAVNCHPPENPSFTNCIFWGNTPNTINTSGNPAITYCDVEGGFTGEVTWIPTPCS